ncbi:septation protein A [Viridibacterium curvum]|uniref:Inner membrane-spanning protein YciB n=1 Tax=Viridibacterium curvum TaxID=1101404 RepID=A0ABP9QAS1_9RHOO
MKLLFDFFPIVLFFVAYKFGDIYVATLTTMGATLVQLILTWLITKRVDNMLKVSAGIIFGLGSLTLIFHNPDFIKWKPTVIYWIMAIALLVSQLAFKRNLIRAAMQEHIQLPDPIWSRLNFAWIAFLAIMGVVNILVAYSYSEATWVNFKVGSIGITLVFCVAQMMSIARYLPKDPS